MTNNIIYSWLKNKKYSSTIIIFISHGLAVLLSISTVLGIGYFLKNWSSYAYHAKNMYGFLEEHRLISEVVGTFVTLGVIEFVYHAIKAFKYANTARNAGLFHYKNKGDDKILCDKIPNCIDSTNCSHIYIQCSTGWGTFGDPKSPLYQAIHHCTDNVTDIKIILLNPKSKGAEERAMNIKTDQTFCDSLKDVTNRIYDSIKLLDEQRKRNKRIQLKMYHDYPTWKVILTDRILWVQHYSKKGHVRESPSFGFEQTEDGQGLYLLFTEQFNAFWDCPSLAEYDFDTGEVEYKAKELQRGKRELIWPNIEEFNNRANRDKSVQNSMENVAQHL